MLAKLTMKSIRALTWFCVVLLAVLSLLPAQDMVRTGFPGRVEHIAAYAGSAAIAMAGYGASRGPRRSSAAFGCMPASWSTSSTSLPVGTQRSRISRHRRSGRCAAAS